ncbi:POK6 protein, partial [Halcyon senegalensis]|nr:POK6 protein [Halcyon senegalensis]
DGSPQIVELRSMVMVFQNFMGPVNIVTDSAYVAGLVCHLDKAVLRHVGNEKLFGILKLLWIEIQKHRSPYYIMHIRSNARKDATVAAVVMRPVSNRKQQAIESHRFFHQGHRALRCQFQLSNSEAWAIVAACPDCQGQHVPHYYGTNPRGLRALQVWQTDVTHVTEFGRLKYVHVSIDIFSSVVVATANIGKAAKDVIQDRQWAFSVAGAPQQVKTDNGLAYMSTKLAAFLQLWGITHVTGIPHSPTRQGIVEHAHDTVECMLQKQ